MKLDTTTAIIVTLAAIASAYWQYNAYLTIGLTIIAVVYIITSGRSKQ